MHHPGNIMFRDFIHCNLEDYSSIKSKKESTLWTCWGVVRKLKRDHGARFLKETIIDTNITTWEEVPNEILLRTTIKILQKKRL